MKAFALGLALIAAPVVAQVPAATSTIARPDPARPDPARLAAARLLAAQVVPAGTYRRMMDGTLSQLMNGMMGQIMDVPVKQFAAAAGASETDVAKLGSATTRQIMTILDPAFQDRMRVTTDVMMRSMVDLMEGFEPQLREGLAEAYATRFSGAQLADINRFFETPSGRAFSGQLMVAMADPAIMRQMQSFLPAMVQAMPKMIQQAQAATAGLPKARKVQDLSPAEIDTLAKLLGVDPARVKASAKETKL